MNLSHLMTKPNKMACAPSGYSDQPGHPPSLIRVFAVRLKKAWILSYPLSAQWRLIRLGRCPGWPESSLGAHAILLVLSRCGSYGFECFINSIVGYKKCITYAATRLGWLIAPSERAAHVIFDENVSRRCFDMFEICAYQHYVTFVSHLIHTWIIQSKN